MIEKNNQNKNYQIVLNKNGKTILQTGTKSFKLNYLVPIDCKNFHLAK